MQQRLVKYKEAGFTLAEVLIALAVSSGLILISISIFSMANKGTVDAHTQGNISETVFAIDQALNTTAGCEETFVKNGPVNPNGEGTKIDKIFFRENSLLYQKNSPIGQTGASHSITISEITLKNFVQAASNRGHADFYVTLQAKGQKPLEKKFGIGVLVKNNIVVGCIKRAEPTIDCVGDWGKCSKDCDGGTQQYTITLLERNGGESCPHADKESRLCNPQSCSSWVASPWGACSGGSGFWTYGGWGTCTGKVTSSTGPYCDGTTFYFCTSCSWNGTQTKTGTCNFSANSGSQTRAVTCQKNGATVADSECKDVKPASSQSCTPTDSQVCGSQSNPPRSCTPSEPSPCTFTEECVPQGPC